MVRALVLASAGRLAGARVMLHTHTGLLEDCMARRAYRLAARATLAVVDAFVVVSRSGERAVSSIGDVGKRKVVRIENGVDVDLFTPGPKRNDRPALAFVGTVCERKGLIDLRDALALLSNDGALPVRVVIVGDGEQEDTGALDRVREAYRRWAPDDVRFTGALPSSEVRPVLAATDIFCLPSHTEGFPLSILEAMSSGVAVVATTVGDLPEMLADGNAGILVPPHDSVALAAAVERLVSDPVERARLGRAARARAVEHYSKDRMREALLALYEAMAGTEPSGFDRRRGSRADRSDRIRPSTGQPSAGRR
jgi:glycosyltransferase involved in cell wall biosynthesis